MFAIFDALYNGHIVWRHLLDFALPSTSCVCWYFSAYMLLLVLSPIVNMGVDFLSKKYFSLALVFIIAIEFFGGTLYRVNGTTFMQLFYIYLIGRYLKKYPIAIVEKYSMHVFFLAMSFNVVLVFLCSYFQLGCDSLLRMIENNRNPLVLLSSICLFMMVKNRKEIRITKWLAKLAPYMFSVYISHVYLLYLNLINFKALIVGNALISMFVYSFLLLIVCIVLDKIRLFFFGGILNRLETSLTSLILKQ